MVGGCPLTVDAYVVAGRDVGFPRLDCRSCGGPMVLWSGYWRHVRAGGRCRRIFVPRERCGSCRVSHALLPAFVLAWRLDTAETAGAVIAGVAGGLCGSRPAAERADVPHTTARGWVRRVGAPAPGPRVGVSPPAVLLCRGPVATAARARTRPDGSARRYSRGTADRWLRAWRAGGLEALWPAPRADTGVVRAHPELFAEAAALRLELPGRSAAQIASILYHRHGVAVAERTVRGQLRRAGLDPAALA